MSNKRELFFRELSVISYASATYCEVAPASVVYRVDVLKQVVCNTIVAVFLYRYSSIIISIDYLILPVSTQRIVSFRLSVGPVAGLVDMTHHPVSAKSAIRPRCAGRS